MSIPVIEHVNGLTPAEAERLALLIEECAEVQAMACKVLRHGYNSRNPLINNSPKNREDLEKEIGHLLNVVEMMQWERDVIGGAIAKAQSEKRVSIKKWLHYAGGAQ